MVLYFSNSSSSSIRNTPIYCFYLYFLIYTHNFLSYPLILCNMTTTKPITSSNYTIKYLELVFVSINFVLILSTLTSQIFIVFIAFFAP